MTSNFFSKISASGWSHRKSPNSSSAMSATVSLPRLRLRARTRAPALPRSRRAKQYRRREAVPGSTQAGADMGDDCETEGGTDVSIDGSIDGSIGGGALSDAIYIIPCVEVGTTCPANTAKQQ